MSKRKLDDYNNADDSTSAVTHHVSTSSSRMRKDDQNPSTSSSSLDDPTRIQFFVRTLSDPTLVLIGRPTDSIRSLHEKIQASTGMPVEEQRLIYRGKQLQWQQTLHECGVQNDAVLHLVGRMRSTGHPQAWQLINEVVSYVFYLYKNHPVALQVNLIKEKTVKERLDKFLELLQGKDDHTGEHLHIFTTSSAPQALVMLYMSSHRSNKDDADDAIRHFIAFSTGKNKRSDQYLPVVLEFCKLLCGAAGSDDPLYVYCRNHLGNMVLKNPQGDTDEDRKGPHTEVGGRINLLLKLHDIFPFVKELALKLSRDLVFSMESITFSGPAVSDVKDFGNFSVRLTIEIKKNPICCGTIRIPLCEELLRLPVCYAEEIAEITYFHGVFLDLLDKLDKCLLKIEEHMDWVIKQTGESVSAWCQYLAILKELNSISKLYDGCEELFWETLKKRKGALCYLIVKHAKRSDDNKWILECKEVVNFEAKRHLALMMLPEVKDEFEELHEMLIDRSHLLAESFEYIAHAAEDSLRAGLFMEFKNEEATGPGVLREWFVLVCQEIFNPQNALFVACPNDRRRFLPNPASKVDPLHLQYFRFSGRVIALALMHRVQIGIVFDRSFVLQLAGDGVSLEDLQDADPYLYSSCKQILEMDAEAVDQDALGLTFVDETEELGARKSVELCDGGRNMTVNSKNRKQYVDSLVKHRFVTAVHEQVKHFANGFSDIAPNKMFFKCLDPEDLDRMLHGSESSISVDDWKAHTDYHGFKETDSQISWFWKIVGLMSPEQKKVLLFFWTSIKYLPVEGFGGLSSRLFIYKTSEADDRLPSSHTCFYRLCFPAYSTFCAMRDRLSIITQEHVGCSFGTW